MGKTQIIAEPGIPQIMTGREFVAPRELLFRAYTDHELLLQWFGPRRLTMTIDCLENRDGGKWRFLHTNTDGNDFGFHGVFHGMPSPEGIVRTFEFEGKPGHVCLETLTFEERGGKTVACTNSVYQSVEDRDGMIRSGMEEGLDDTLDRLDELIARLAPVS